MPGIVVCTLHFSALPMSCAVARRAVVVMLITGITDMNMPDMNNPQITGVIEKLQNLFGAVFTVWQQQGDWWEPAPGGSRPNGPSSRAQ